MQALRGRFQQQKVPDRPRDRISEEDPFTFCGADIFGSFVVKNGCKEINWQGLSTPAILAEPYTLIPLSCV